MFMPKKHFLETYKLSKRWPVTRVHGGRDVADSDDDADNDDKVSDLVMMLMMLMMMLKRVTHGPCGREVPIRARGVMPCLPSMAHNLTEGQSTQGGEG